MSERDRNSRSARLRAQSSMALRQLGGLRLLLTGLFLILAMLVARYSWTAPVAIEAERLLYDWRQVQSAPKVDQELTKFQIFFSQKYLVIQIGWKVGGQFFDGRMIALKNDPAGG